MTDFTPLFGKIEVCFDERGELKPENPKAMFKRYSASLRNALNAAERKMDCMESALNAFKCVATRRDIPVPPENFGVLEDGLTVDEMLDKMESYVIEHIFDGGLAPVTDETPDKGAYEEVQALKADVAAYRERAEKAEARVRELEAELEAAKKQSETAEPRTGNISSFMGDLTAWGGMFKDIAGLFSKEELSGGEPVTEYEAALSVMLSGVKSKSEFDSVGGFVNANYVAALKSAMLEVVSSRGEKIFISALNRVEPRFIADWKPAFSKVRALAVLNSRTDIMEMGDIPLYGRLREIYAQSNRLEQFKPETVSNNFDGQINGFIQNLQTAADSPPEAENSDDDLPFEFKGEPQSDAPLKTEEQASNDFSKAIQRGNDIIREGIEAYKANPAAWKEIIEDRRKAMGVTAAQYSDEDAIQDILRLKPYLRPENYKTEREDVPPFDGFEFDPLLALPQSEADNKDWLNDKLFPNWIDRNGERFKEYGKLLRDVLPELKKDDIIGKLFNTRKLDANERFPAALAACGGILRYKDAQNMLKYKDIDETWGAAYRKLVGAIAVSCCVQMTIQDGVGKESRVYGFDSVSKEAGVPEWVNDAMSEALSIKGYSTALLSLRLENRPQGKKLAAKSERKVADKDGYFYDAQNESYAIVRKGEPLDEALTEVSEDAYNRGTEYNLPPDRAQNLLNACRLWKLVPESVSWEKACDPDYDAEWIAEIRRHAQTHPDANLEGISKILDSGDNEKRRALIRQFQIMYKNAKMPLERVWKFLLGDDFDVIAPWEPSETADLDATCKAAAEEWERFTGSGQ